MQVQILVDGKPVAVLTEYPVHNPDHYWPISYYRLEGDRNSLPKWLFNHERIIEVPHVRNHSDAGRDMVVRGEDSRRDRAVE